MNTSVSFPLEKEFAPYTESLELKEIGFDEPCFGYYNTMGFNRYFDNIKNSDNLIESENIKGNWCTAPTYSQAFRWFREKHQLPSWVYTSNNQEYWYSVLKDGRMIVRDYNPFKSYEEAELACIIKLIKLVKNK